MPLTMPVGRVARTALTITQRSGDDPVQLLLEIARQAGIAVAYEYRATIDPDNLLTDEQWERVKPFLEGYDEVVGCDSEANLVWRERAFAEAGATCPNCGEPLAGDA